MLASRHATGPSHHGREVQFGPVRSSLGAAAGTRPLSGQERPRASRDRAHPNRRATPAPCTAAGRAGHAHASRVAPVPAGAATLYLSGVTRRQPPASRGPADPAKTLKTSSSCHPCEHSQSLAHRAPQSPPPSLALPERGRAVRVPHCSFQSPLTPQLGAHGWVSPLPQTRVHCPEGHRPPQPRSSLHGGPSAHCGELCRLCHLLSPPHSPPSRRVDPLAQNSTGRRNRGGHPTPGTATTWILPPPARAGTRPRSAAVDAVLTIRPPSARGGGGDHAPPISLDS